MKRASAKTTTAKRARIYPAAAAACPALLVFFLLLSAFIAFPMAAAAGKKVSHRQHELGPGGGAPWRIVVQSAGGNASSAAAEAVKKRAEGLMAGVVEYLGHRPDWTYTIVITTREHEFERAASGVPGWAVAIYSNRKIVIRPDGFSADPAVFYNTIQHELVHGVLDHLFRHNPSALPRWLNEGLAVAISGSWESPQSWESRKTSLYAAIKKGSALDFEDIEYGFPRGQWLAQVAYAQSADFVQFLERRGGRDGIRNLLAALAAGGEKERAFQSLYGKSFDGLVADWKEEVKKPGAAVWVMHVLANFDLYIWLAIVALVIAGFFLVRRRPSRTYPDDEYDPYEDWDELDEEWDPDTYGFRPWRPGRRR